MSTLLQSEALTVEPHESFVTFERDKPSGWSNRYLNFVGERAWHIGYWCETCNFAFEQVRPTAPWKIPPRELSSRLNVGVSTIDDDVVQTAAQLLPGGEYRVCLFKLVPIWVSPGTSKDYFANELERSWDMDSSGVSPRDDYYRTPEQRVRRGDEVDRFFEFVVPFYTGVSPATVSSYGAALLAGAKPTALSVSLLDLKFGWDRGSFRGGPWFRSELLDRQTDRPGETHLCLSHYLLDGHHKVFAASLLQRPITLLSFLSMDHSFATAEVIDLALNHLAGGAAP